MTFRIETNLKIHYIVLLYMNIIIINLLKEINKISGSNFGDFDSKSEQNMVAHQNTQWNVKNIFYITVRMCYITCKNYRRIYYHRNNFYSFLKHRKVILSYFGLI